MKIKQKSVVGKATKKLKKFSKLKQRNLYHVKFKRQQLLNTEHQPLEQALIVASKKTEVKTLMLIRYPNMDYCNVKRVNLKNKGFIKEIELSFQGTKTVIKNDTDTITT